MALLGYSPQAAFVDGRPGQHAPLRSALFPLSLRPVTPHGAFASPKLGVQSAVHAPAGPSGRRQYDASASPSP